MLFACLWRHRWIVKSRLEKPKPPEMLLNQRRFPGSSPMGNKNALKIKERQFQLIWGRGSENLLAFCSVTSPDLFPQPLSSHFVLLCPLLVYLCRWPSRILSISPDLARLLSPFHSRLWLIYAIILSSSIRALSLFWRLVNSQLMIYQILITARWKPHSLSWCMVMIAAALLHESQQTLSFIFLFLSPLLLSPAANSFFPALSLQLCGPVFQSNTSNSPLINWSPSLVAGSTSWPPEDPPLSVAVVHGNVQHNYGFQPFFTVGFL